jgi:hypothetical protein
VHPESHHLKRGIHLLKKGIKLFPLSSAKVINDTTKVQKGLKPTSTLWPGFLQMIALPYPSLWVKEESVQLLIYSAFLELMLLQSKFKCPYSDLAREPPSILW